MKMDLLPYNNDNIPTAFPPILKRNFEELFYNGDIGLTSLTLSDISATKQYTEDDSNFSYSFNVRVPYAGKRLVWEIIFNPEEMAFAPDFNFNDDNFTLSNNIDKILDEVPSLMNWNVNNPKSLTSLLKEFLDLYKKQQIEKLEQDNIYAQLNSEYQILTEEVSPHDIEMYLESTCAHFLINVRVDTSMLPEYLQSQSNSFLLNPGRDTCIIKVSYLKLDATRTKTSLQLSPRLDQVLGNAQNLGIPAYAKATSLADYVNLVTKMVQDHVKNVERRYKLRKEYITCMCTMFPGNIIEFDSTTFSKGEILIEVDNFECLVKIELGERFPDEQPIVTLFSIYCVPTKKVCSEQVTSFLYSPRWSPENMLNKMMESLTSTIGTFKNHRH